MSQEIGLVRASLFIRKDVGSRLWSFTINGKGKNKNRYDKPVISFRKINITFSRGNRVAMFLGHRGSRQ